MIRKLNQFLIGIALLLYGYSPAWADIKAAIFDCDGTLIDSECLKFLAWQEALENKNIAFSIEEYMPVIGLSSKSILRWINQSKNLELSEDVIEVKNSRYKILQQKGGAPIEPMVHFVHQLFENKQDLCIKLALASSASQKEIALNLKHLCLENVFEVIVSGSNDLDAYIDAEGKNKPKPYIYIETAKRLGVLPENCLVFEDSSAGVISAAEAGMTVIAVPNQYTSNQDFTKASRILFSYQDLPSLEEFRVCP